MGADAGGGGSGELESYLGSRPFETYPLMRGQGRSARPAGVFKAIVRVTETDPRGLPDSEQLLDMARLLVGATGRPA